MTDWRKLLAGDVVAKIETEIDQAYKRGWEECLERIAECVQKQRLQSEPKPGRAPRGIWRSVVEQILQDHGMPMKVSEIMTEAERRVRRPAPRASIYQALDRLRDEGLAERCDDGRWVFRPTGTSNAPAT